MTKLENIKKLFAELKLSAFTEHYEDAFNKEKDINAIMVKLCKYELDRRYDRKIKGLIRQANFSKIKTLAMLSYKKAPKLPKKKVVTLSECTFIEEKRNALFIGDSGGGKTHLGIALGIEACRKKYTVKFYTACQLVNLLKREIKEGDIEKFLSKLKKVDLLIIDELGYVPFSKDGARLLFRVISDRYESGSIIITSNIKFSKWTELFFDKSMTTALLDRITHKAEMIKYDWGSVRFDETNKN